MMDESVDTMYAAPEIALGLAIVEKYKPEEAVRLWKEGSVALRWMEHWIPSIAESYSIHTLQKLIGTPIPEQQSDIWSLGISYLCMYDTLSKQETPFPEKDKFFEAISDMLRLRGRVLPSVELDAETVAPFHHSGKLNETLVCDETAAPPRPGRLMLTEPIRRGERNKTRRNPHN